MPAIEDQLLTALTELEKKVESIRTASQRPNLIETFERIEALTRQLPRDTHPDLLHYLHKKSYEKAKLWLLGREAENARGDCRSGKPGREHPKS